MRSLFWIKVLRIPCLDFILQEREKRYGDKVPILASSTDFKPTETLSERNEILLVIED